MFERARSLRGRHLGLLASTLLAVVLSGCISSTRNPERLFPVGYEMEQMRGGQDDLIKQYWILLPANPSGARTIRNEIITQRMYAIDVQYTQYETALTREVQQVGFGTLTTAGGLTTASTLVVSAGAKTILSALATAVLNTKGHYEAEVLLAQTMRAIQKQMRLSRNNAAIVVAGKMGLSVADYPLWAALSDVEDYYQAGTLTSGIVDISTTVGIRETESKEVKDRVTTAPAAQRAAMILGTSTTPIPDPGPPGVLNSLGRNRFEREGLTPVIICQMEVVLGLPRVGRLTDGLRVAVLGHRGRPVTPTAAISNRDAIFIIEEFNGLPAGQRPRCP